MKLRNPWLVKLAGLLGYAGIGAWMRTLDYRVAYYDPTVDPVHPDYRGHKIYLFWHEYIPFPLVNRGHNNMAMLLSQHGDADVLERLALHFGFGCVRGSTRRGAVAALRMMTEFLEQHNIAITPDGPRGPRRTMAVGPIYLSSQLQVPLVCMGFGYDRPWRLGSWDRFAIARPGSRARAVLSPAIQIPPDLDRDGLEHYRQQTETLLTRLTVEAEEWADSPTHRVGEVAARREVGYRPFRRVQSEPSLAGREPNPEHRISNPEN